MDSKVSSNYTHNIHRPNLCLKKWEVIFIKFSLVNFLKIGWLLVTYNSYQIAYFCFSMSELMEYSKKNEKLENIGRSTLKQPQVFTISKGQAISFP